MPSQFSVFVKLFNINMSHSLHKYIIICIALSFKILMKDIVRGQNMKNFKRYVDSKAQKEVWLRTKKENIFFCETKLTQ